MSNDFSIYLFNSSNKKQLFETKLIFFIEL